jgi:uncharacterized membrane protein YkvA (DUF1232 family)
MSPLLWALAALLALYVAFLAALVLAGHGAHARAAARFVPDCAVLLGRLARDPRVPRMRRWSLALVGLYLLSPIDLVPDFLPVIGQLDDALLVLVALRGVVKAAGVGIVREHWPGPDSSLATLLRAAGYQAAR